MSALDAIRRAADHYPGGRKSLLPRVDSQKADEVFRKELAGGSNHKLGAEMAVTIAAMCCEVGSKHCFDFASFVAEECGGTFTPGLSKEVAAVPPLNRVADLVREAGDVVGVVIAAMADGVITDNEFAQIEREVAEAECVLRRLRQAARVVNLRGKPAEVRSQTDEQWLREHAGVAA